MCNAVRDTNIGIATNVLLVPIIRREGQKEIETTQKETVYDVDSFPYDCIPNLRFSKGWKREVIENVFLTFDIESTTIADGKRDPWGFMYHWQADLYNIDTKQHCVIFGRRWEEFDKFRTRLTWELVRRGAGQSRFMAFVHNLSFEFYFMFPFLDHGSTIFARAKNSVLSIREPELNWEWRCSYALTNRSLLKACENEPECIHRKLSGSYNYRVLRTADTKLTEEERGYCYNDVAGLAEVIAGYHRHDPFIQLPLTSTGFVRRDLRRYCRKDKKYHEHFRMMQFDKTQYQMMLEAFRGGDTHASRYYAGQVVHDVICRDFASAYPAVMMQEYFPSGPPIWCKIETQEQLDYYISRYCVVMEVEYYSISTTAPDPYISIAKTKARYQAANDNGRVLEAEYLRLTITEIDYQIIKQEYNYKSLKVLNAFYFDRKPLPVPIRQCLAQYYKGKTELKGVEGAEYEYAKWKELLNAIYGCSATHLHTEEWVFRAGEWETEKAPIEETITEYFSSRNNVLPYQWALYVTAHVRKRLHELIGIVGKDRFLYCDTDSVYYISTPEIENKIEEWNRNIIEKSPDDIPCFATDRKGKKRWLGIAEVDKEISAYKTFGAKKYMYQDQHGKHITVAGLSKSAVSYFPDFDSFRVGVTVPAGISGRTVAYRESCDPKEIEVDGCRMLYAGGIGIVDTTYTLGLTLEYQNLLGLSQEDL